MAPASAPSATGHLFRIRTVTAFLEMPTDLQLWVQEIEAAGAFLSMAQRHLEQLGERRLLLMRHADMP